MLSKILPLVGGLCHVTDSNQMWSKNVPLIGGLCHVTDFDQMWSKNVPLVRGLCHVLDFIQLLSDICCGSRQITITFKRKAQTNGIHGMKGINHICEDQKKAEYRAQSDKKNAYHVHHATKNK